jgi:HK97 family phage major capsid protein
MSDIKSKAVDTEKRTARFSFSSDTPYKRWFGYETLSHKNGAMDSVRADYGAMPFLLNHDWEKQIGKVKSHDNDGTKAYADVKLSRSKIATEAMNDMADEIKTEISVGYIVHEMKKIKKDSDGKVLESIDLTREEIRSIIDPDGKLLNRNGMPVLYSRSVSFTDKGEARVLIDDDDDEEKTPEYLVTKWEPLEVSLVSVPADYTVGVGRSFESVKESVNGVNLTVEESQETIDPAQIILGEADKDDDELDPDADTLNQATVDTGEIEVVTRNEEVIIPSKSNFMAEPVTNTETTVEVKHEDLGKVREQEVARIRKITAIGGKFDAANEALEYVRDGKSVADFQKYVLDNKMKTAEPTIRQVDTSLGLTIKDQKKYNLCKAITESAFKKELSGFEAECSQEVAKLVGRSPEGFFLPEFAIAQMSQRSDLVAGTNNLGGFTIQTTVEPSLIPLLRNKMVVGRAGATMMGGLVGNMALPRQITAATATWNSENNDPTRTNLTFDQVSLTPQRLSAVTAFSKQLLAQSQLDVQTIVRDDLLKIIAIAQDLAALSGTGASNQPTGILNTTADTVFPSAYAKTSPSITFSSSGYPTWTNIVNFEGNVEQNNVDLDDASVAYIVSPAVKALWKTLAKFDPRATNQFYPAFLMEDVGTATDGRAGTINGYKAFATQQLSSNKVIFGKFSDLVIGTWGGLDLITDPYTLASTFQVRVIVNLLTTIVLRYGPSFCYSTNTGMQNGA